MEETLTALKEYLTGEDWQNIGVIAIGEDLYVTIEGKHYNGLPIAAQALAGSLTAYGDYELLERTAMRTPDGEIVSVTYKVRAN